MLSRIPRRTPAAAPREVSELFAPHYTTKPHQPISPAAIGQLLSSVQHPLVTTDLSRYVSGVIFSAHLPSQSLLQFGANSQRVFGIAADVIIQGGLPLLYSHLHPDDLPHVMQIQQDMYDIYTGLSNFRRLGFRSTLVFRFRHPQHGYRWILQQCVVASLDAAGNPEITVGIYDDLSAYLAETAVRGTAEFHDNGGNWTVERLPRVQQGLFTNREREVLKHMADGLSSRLIAEQLHIAPDTVVSHRKRMLVKSGCKNGAELVRFGIENRII